MFFFVSCCAPILILYPCLSSHSWTKIKVIEKNTIRFPVVNVLQDYIKGQSAAPLAPKGYVFKESSMKPHKLTKKGLNQSGTYLKLP